MHTKLTETFLVNNPCYTANISRTDSRYIAFQENGPSGLMLHSTGDSLHNSADFIREWNCESYQRACVHAFIDADDGTVYQTLPWNFRGWHGGGSSNNTHIGVEMCEPACIRYTGDFSFDILDMKAAQASAEITYLAAVELFAMLCIKYHLNPEADICSHCEGYQAGIATNHRDPEHLWEGVGLPYTMDTFRRAVTAAIISKI